MEFPITETSILLYSVNATIQVMNQIRRRLTNDIHKDPKLIREFLQQEILDNVAHNRGKTAFGVHIGNIRDTIADFNRVDVVRMLENEFIDPLIREYFPSAVLKIGVDSDIYLLFTLSRPEASNQTSTPSQ